MKNKLILLYCSALFTILGCSSLLFVINSNSRSFAAENGVNINMNVLSYINSSITNTTVNMPDLTPGIPVAGPATGNVLTVSTNSLNGYTVAVRDDVASSNSALLHTDGTTRIADYSGTVATPTSWTGEGLGLTLFAADTSKEAKWGTGTTYNDSNNKYAGVPESAATIHTVSSYLSGADTSSWAFKADAPNTQKTGAYSGTVTFIISPTT